MGNNTSSAFSATDIVNNVISSTIMSVSNRCGVDTSNVQEINVSDLNLVGCELNISGLSQQQSVSTNFNCFQQTQFANNIKNDLSNALDQQLKATLSGLNLNLNSQTDVETLTTIKNNIVNNVDMSSVSNCVSSNINSQKINVGKITANCTGMKNPKVNISDINQKIISDSVANCTQQSAALNSAITQLDNFVKQKLDAENQGLSMATLMTGLIIFGVIALIILAIALGFNPFTMIMRFFSSLFSSGDEQQPSVPPAQPPTQTAV